MSQPYEVHGVLPTLHEPLLLVHLTGWIDAAGAGAAAMARVDEACRTTTIVTFDSDAFVDYRARRPTVELRNGVSDRIIWNNIELRAGHDPAGRAVLTLSGPEPDANWKLFRSAVGDLCAQLGVQRMLTLGAYPYASPHTRPALMSVTSPSAELIRDLPHNSTSLDIPGGMAAVLDHWLTERGIPCIGLWAQVPHYVSGMSFPAASVTLLRAVESIGGLAVDVGALEQEAMVQRNRIEELVQGNDEHRAMVRQLEALYDREQPELPSSDELAAEVERFLRDQGDQ